MPEPYSVHVANASTLPLVAALAGRVHGPAVETLTTNLAKTFPEPVIVLWVRHDPTGTAVSTLSLIPWTWRLGSTHFPVWETGIVATDEDHRGRGLSSLLMREAEALRRQAGVAASIIQGIPYFYRRYGYEFAAPLETHVEWELRHLPREESVQRRAAGLEDVGRLATWFGGTDHELASVRSEAHWRYRLLHSPGTETEAQFFLVADRNGAEGAFAVAQAGFGEGLIVSEVGGDPLVWPTIASEIRAEAEARRKPYVRLHLGARHPFVFWAQTRGARFTGSWHWQIRFDDPEATLDQLSPEWRARWPDHLPGRLVLDLYQGRKLVLERGGTRAAAPEVVASVPPELLPPLVLGWKPLSALRETRPDLFGSPEALALLEALFPMRTAFCGSLY